ncbi:hypothetical protein GDO78_009575 [Eleutherodactylus coqui]|uniref:Uncharacterized protein n=1 Tax=Eleutherodactylus coqui TaxID=57060 RepID=A0A8J6F9W0_ELECQ|nr:hypothetical protein GDO78_009575 [Eleutherodactylus coqui]
MCFQYCQDYCCYHPAETVTDGENNTDSNRLDYTLTLDLLRIYRSGKDQKASQRPTGLKLIKNRTTQLVALQNELVLHDMAIIPAMSPNQI